MDEKIEYSFVVNGNKVVFKSTTVGVTLPDNCNPIACEKFLKTVQKEIKPPMRFYSNSISKCVHVDTEVTPDFLEKINIINRQSNANGSFKVFFESNDINLETVEVSGRDSFLIKIKNNGNEDMIREHAVDYLKLVPVIPKVFCLYFSNEGDASDNFKEFQILKSNENWIEHLEVNFGFQEYVTKTSQLKNFSAEEFFMENAMPATMDINDLQKIGSKNRKKAIARSLEHPKYRGYVNGKMLNLISAPNPNDSVPERNSIIIGIADTSIDFSHQALYSVNRRIVSKSFIYDDIQPELNNIKPHGMQSLGLITGYEKNAINGKTFHSPGSGFAVTNAVMLENQNDDTTIISLVSVLQSIFWLAIEQEVDVISCSWRLPYSSNIVIELIRDIVTGKINNKKTPLIFSAGNDSKEVAFPATMDEVIAVGGTDLDGKYAVEGNLYNWFSAEGTAVDLAAPGSFMISTDFRGDDGINLTYDSWISKDYCFHFGTSAAAPLVSACVGLMLKKNGSLTPSKIKDLLKSSATKPQGWDVNNWGDGILNIEATLAKIN